MREAWNNYLVDLHPDLWNGGQKNDFLVPFIGYDEKTAQYETYFYNNFCTVGWGYALEPLLINKSKAKISNSDIYSIHFKFLEKFEKIIADFVARFKICKGRMNFDKNNEDVTPKLSDLILKNLPN